MSDQQYDESLAELVLSYKHICDFVSLALHSDGTAIERQQFESGSKKGK